VLGLERAFQIANSAAAFFMRPSDGVARVRTQCGLCGPLRDDPASSWTAMDRGSTPLLRLSFQKPRIMALVSEISCFSSASIMAFLSETSDQIIDR
jgi:hypothetical protein